MKLSLIVQTPGPNQGKALEIKLPQFVVGRDPQCHLRPASPMISKRHCAVLQREEHAFVRDFDSTNGTFVNEEQVKGEVELHDGDRLKMGPLVFDVKIETTAPINRPTPPPTKPAAKTATQGKPGAVAIKAPPKPAASNETDTEVPAAKAETKTERAVSSDEDRDSSSNDDDIAAMLLSLHDDGTAGPSGIIPEVPEGSTIHEMPLPPEVAAQMAQTKNEKAKAASGNTSQAAKSILEKYMKRPRPQ